MKLFEKIHLYFINRIEKYGTTIKVQILGQMIVLTIDLKATKVQQLLTI